ncbi:MAG: TIGR04076 family protein [Planctomycetota bacterium]
MQRRDFIGCAAVSSVCAMAPAAVAQTATGKKRKKKSCKITVLKKTIHNDLYKQIRGKEGKLCDLFEEGQEFILTSPYKPPEGFCQWAWADIRQYILAAWSSPEYVTVACCTDGFRPVFFKVERIA